ncbi:MKI67 FHA domain-interacting nucleolar phosphoprotein-like [Zerene cesonia]|uniref:MKI67 FHA domain-interacting nucleolar phosphoprotein-like n=1 Tax=Zerene cesonia TaxID=33412 RepID=UPI0018E52FD0|nr:MKI67 FHA domain-interacting nucleolar phosphoprotein-like [Zerene cesonia]
MEENVALDSNKQKDFVKSVKGIKKLIKKQNNKEKQTSKPDSKPIKNGKITKRKHRPKGLVYLGHIPHGFYEHEMTQYFRQFGMVTNARVIRSKRTGNSKGYAFVEFKDPAVAQVVAETMNNYLMGKRLIKAAYIPPEKQKRFAKRKHWTFENNPGVENRKKHKKEHNAVKSEDKDLQTARNMLSTLNKTKKKLKEMGIDYDFFMPVDIPEGIDLKQKNESPTQANTNEKKPIVKKEGKKEKNDKKVKEEETEPAKKIVETKSGDKKTKKEKSVKPSEQNIKAELKDKKDIKKSVLKQKDTKSDDAVQKQKRKSLKDSNVKLLEDFIKIQEDDEDGDSDGSLEFDSDEFEKVMGEDDSVGSSDESDEPLDSEVTSEDEEEEKVQKIVQAKPKPVVAIKKAPKQKNVSPPKKGKFEKQPSKKTLNKVIKKKK